MPESSATERVRRALLRLGLPADYASRAAEEAAGHLEDLRREAIEKGLTPRGSEAYAVRAFGDSEDLAARMAEAVKSGSWFGRHSLCSCFFLPVLTLVAAFLGAIVAAALLGDWLGLWAKHLSWSRSTRLAVWWALQLVYCGLLIVVPVFYCWLARRRFGGWKGLLIIAGAFLLHGIFHTFTISAPSASQPGSVTWGCHTHIQAIALLVPLATVFLFWWANRLKLPLEPLQVR
ncbi:MAG TPA: hypothetical protein VN829_23475 [Dongiaceae bacterium]|nr:hypothetical protein [Dongiaceae bacterium]